MDTEARSDSDMAWREEVSGVDAALEELRRGRPVVLVDGGGQGIDGDLLLAAEHASNQSVAFLVRHTSGYLGVAADVERWQQLQIPLMPGCTEPCRPYGVAVDARKGITTGISAQDRARTIRMLADPATQPEDLVRPGHVATIHAKPADVLVRHGRAEAAVDLMRLAGLRPVVALGQVVRDDGPTADGAELRALARAHDLAVVTIDELIAYRSRNSATVVRAVTTQIPTDYGEVTLHGYQDQLDGGEHLAIVFGRPENEAAPVVGVHEECLTGDAFGSCRCDCGRRLDHALTAIATRGAGVVVYLRGHGGAGIVERLRAFALREGDTHDATAADHGEKQSVDGRPHLRAAAHILRDLGIERVRLLTTDPTEASDLQGWGVTVDAQFPFPANQDAASPANQAKRQMLGHVLAAS